MAGLTVVLHGFSGVGKSWLADTAPAPRLVLDAEGGADFTPSGPKIEWNPYEPPPALGDWTTCVVRIRDFGTLQRVFQWLNAGQHPFESVIVDSLTEVQKRCLDQVVGTSAPQTQDWGTLLRYMEGLVREFRDLKTHPLHPLRVIVFVCLASERDEMITPHVQGQLRDTLPGYVDVVGYVYASLDEQGQPTRQMLIQPSGKFAAKDRTNKLTLKYGAVVPNAALNLEQMLLDVLG